MGLTSALLLGMVIALAVGSPLLAVALAGLVGANVSFIVLQMRAWMRENTLARETMHEDILAIGARVAELADRLKVVQNENSTARDAALSQVLGRLEVERRATAEERQRMSSLLGEMRREMMDQMLSALDDADRKAELRADQAVHVSPEQLDAIQQHLGQEVAKLQRRFMRLQWNQTREIEALLQLFRDFEPRAPMPSSGGWALNPTGLLELLVLIERKRPKLVVELGSGSSSVWLGYAVEKMGGRLISFDHEPRFAERTRSLLVLHQLSHVSEVRLAQLAPLRLGNETFDWYESEAFEDLKAIDLLFVDGPPGRTGVVARYPAFPVLEARLADQATIVLDDADRADEQEVVRRWNEAVGGLTRERDIFSGQAVLTYSRGE